MNIYSGLLMLGGYVANAELALSLAKSQPESDSSDVKSASEKTLEVPAANAQVIVGSRC